jgi:hypothetical protein
MVLDVAASILAYPGIEILHTMALRKDQCSSPDDAGLTCPHRAKNTWGAPHELGFTE